MARKIFDDYDEANIEIDDISFDDPNDIEDIVDDEYDPINKGEILIDVLRREIRRAEPDRDSLEFKVIGDFKNEYEGIPMAEIPGQDAFIFKLLPEGRLKKFRIEDIEIL